MQDLRVLSIEDNGNDQALLEQQLNHYAQRHHIEISMANYRTAPEFLSTRSDFDVLFLDIDLPEMTGMETAHLIRSFDRSTPIIFVTSLAQYAIKGYEVDAIGFIVKPIRYHDLEMCMGKVERILGRNENEKLSFSGKSGITAFPASSVSFVETSRHDLLFHFTSDEPPFRVRCSITKLEEQLSSLPFVRISQSVLANIAHIERIQDNCAIMSTGEKLYFSRSQKRNALARIVQYMGRTI